MINIYKILYVCNLRERRISLETFLHPFLFVVRKSSFSPPSWRFRLMSTTTKEGGGGGGGGEEEEEKVIVLFKATGGDTPLLKQRKVKVLRKAKFVDVVAYVSKLLQRAHVFVYLNDAFTPRYDEEVGRLFDWFGSGSGGGGGAGDASGVGGGGGGGRDETKKKQVLVVNYSTQQAYG